MSFRRILTILASLLVFSITVAEDRERHYDLKHVDWSLSFSEDKGAIFGDVTNTVAPLESATEVTFDCGKLTVRRVFVDGKPATFAHEGEALTVQLGKTVGKGKDVDVRIVYHGVPEAGVYFIPAKRAYPATTGMIYTQGEAEDTRYWLPTWDFPNDKATSSSHITVEPGYYALGNGELLGIDKSATSWTYHWKMDQPHSTYLTSFTVGEYEVGMEDWNGMDVMWLVPKGLGSMGHSSFDGTADMVRFFSELTGFKYPYHKFAQVVVSDYMFGGMENISMVINTIGTLHETNEKPVADSTGLVLHELAHQWFGDAVTARDWSHIWTNEGWASFLPHFYTRETKGEDAYHMGRWGTLQGAYGAARSSDRPMVSDDYQIPMDMFDGNAYGGGAARMFMLLELLGEEVFWECVTAYLNEHRFKNATTESFFNTFSRVSGRDLGQFRQQWFYNAGAPILTSVLEDGTLTVTLEQEHFEIDVPVGVLKNGKWEMHTLKLENGEGKVDLGTVGDSPVLIDPASTIMMGFNKELTYTDEQVLAMYNAAPNAGTKVRLTSKMRGWDQEQKQSLYESEDSIDMKVSLISLFRRGSEEFLIEQSHSPAPRIQAAAIQRLPMTDETDAVMARFKEIWESHPNPRLRTVAVRKLAQETFDPKFADEAWKIQTTNEGLRLFALRWWVVNDKDKGREVCLDQMRNPLNETIRRAAIGHLGGLKDKAGERRVYDALVKAVQEPSFGSRVAALNALASYGDAAALPYMEPVMNHSLFSMRRAAVNAVNRLKRATDGN